MVPDICHSIYNIQHCIRYSHYLAYDISYIMFGIRYSPYGIHYRNQLFTLQLFKLLPSSNLCKFSLCFHPPAHIQQLIYPICYTMPWARRIKSSLNVRQFMCNVCTSSSAPAPAASICPLNLCLFIYLPALDSQRFWFQFRLLAEWLTG